MNLSGYSRKAKTEMWSFGQLFFSQPDWNGVGILTAAALIRDARQFPASVDYVTKQAQARRMHRRMIGRWSVVPRVPVFCVEHLAKALAVFS